MHSSISISDGATGGLAAGKLRIALYVLVGVLAALLGLEVLFRVLPVSTSTQTGYYFDPMIMTYPARLEFTTSFGWALQRAQRQRANNFGFLADHDFVYNPKALVLIGDSFVEGSMLAPSERLGPQLERRLDGRQVYAMGFPGTSLLDYAERIRFASSHFGTHDFVLLLEHGDIAQSLCGSGNTDAPCLDPRTLQPRVERMPPPGRLKRFFRSSALAQYFFSQLKIDPRHIFALIPGRGSRRQPAEPRVMTHLPARSVDAVLREFFDRTRPYRTGRLILVLMADPDPDDPIYVRLTDFARRANVVVVAIEPQLREFTQRTRLSQYVSPTDHHLNRMALGVVAGAVARVLNGRAGEPSTNG